MGRFITPDSIVPAPFNPQTLNRYAYCENNPINYTDPTGHWSWKKFFRSVFSGFIGGLVFAFTGNPMLAGMAAGAVHGGLTGGISGAIRGAAFGGLMGAGMGVGAQLFGPSFAIAALGASAAYTGATQGWEGLGYMAGGIAGGITGYQAGQAMMGGGISDAAKNQQSTKNNSTNITEKHKKVWLGYGKDQLSDPRWNLKDNASDIYSYYKNSSSITFVEDPTWSQFTEALGSGYDIVALHTHGGKSGLLFADGVHSLAELSSMASSINVGNVAVSSCYSQVQIQAWNSLNVSTTQYIDLSTVSYFPNPHSSSRAHGAKKLYNYIKD